MNKTFRSVWNTAKQAWVAAAETVRARGKPGSAVQSAAVAATLLTGLWASGAAAQTAPPSTALPTGGQVSAGQASIGQSGASMVITQGSERAAINWQSFNVGSGAQVQFNQPSSSSVALNRVLGSDPSQIFGRITANGQVILTNPAGVYFGASARVDVGGLVATTKGIGDADFMAGKSRFERNGATGSVVNEGELKAALGGYIALLAPEVRNQGAIIAQMGTVALAAGEAVDLKFDSHNRLTSIRVEPSQIAALVENRHAVQAPGGLVIISAQSMDRLVGGVVKNSGVIEATGLRSDGGRIVLSASTRVEQAGTLDVSSASAQGGQVSLGAETISLQDGGRIDATGATGGGTVLVGGDWQGSADALLQATGQPTQAATTVTMASSARIDASATRVGHGGKVVLWSDIHDPASLTSAHGQIDASAGVGGGDGGQVETSGHVLNTDGIAVRASASGGQKGVWLLDPSDSTITATQVSSYLTSLNSGTDVINFTTGTITWSSGSLLKNAGGNATLTLRAGTHLTISDGVSITSTSGALNLVLWSGYQDAGSRGWTSIGSGAISTNGGHVWVGGGAQNLEGTTTWNGLTVSSHYATSFIAGTSGLRLNGTSITTNGGDIFLKGRYSVGSDTADNMSGIQATNATLNSGSGKLTLEARLSNTRSTHSGINLAGSTSLSGTGDLKFEVNATNSVASIRTNGALSLSRGAGDVTFIADNFSAGTFNVTTTGGVTVEPYSASFHSSGFSLSRISPSGGTLSASSLTIGKSNNTAAITADLNTSIAGPITVYGGNITINAGLVATGGYTITLQGSGTISNGASGYVSADNLLLTGGNVSLTNSTSNAVGTLAASGVSGLTYLDSHALTLGTVGSTNGISATGAINIGTKTGDLTVLKSVSTTNTSANALVLNADMDAAAGSSTGSNLIFTGSPSLSVGAGGVGKLFTGSVSGSTGLIGLSNLAAGSGRFRYNSDETTTRYTTALSAGLNAIFREQPSATTSSLSLTMTYGDALPDITATGTVNGDAAGYAIASRLNSTSGNIRASGTPYAITETLTGLGYLVNSSSSASTGTLTVSAKALTMSGLSVPASKVYKGLSSAVVSGTPTLLSAIASGTGSATDGKRYTNDVVSITGTAVGTYNSKDVASASTVSFSGLSLTGTDASNYSLTMQSPASATITAKALTMSGLVVPSSRVYDGTLVATVSGTPTLLAASAPGAGTTADGKPYTGDTVAFTGTAVGTYNSKDVASATTVTFSGLSLSNSNYSLTIQSPASATITAKPLTMSGLTVPVSKVYDGTLTASVSGTPTLLAAGAAGSGTTADGKPYTGDTVTITGTAVGSYNSKNVASASTVTFSGLSLTGAASGNYSLTIQSPAAATITAKPLTMSGLTVPASRVYDGTLTASVSGTPALLTAQAVGAGSATDGKPYTGDTVAFTGTVVGTYDSKDVSSASTVTFSGLSLNNSNYSLTIQSPAAATITAKPLTMSGLSVPASKVYDGTLTASVSGTPTLLAASAPGAGTTADGKPYTGDTVAFTGTAVGTYNSKDVASASTVTFSGLSLNNSNYSLTIQSPASATITAKALTLSGLSSQDKVYDGTSTAVVIGTAAFQTAIAPGAGSSSDGKPYTGDSISLAGAAVGNFNSPHVASANQVAFTGLSLTGTGSGNYTLTSHAADTTVRITKANLTVTVNDDAKFVVQADRPGFNGVSYSGFVNGETADVLGGSVTISRSNASTNTAGSYSGVLQATGLSSGNYNISYQPGNFTITPSNQLLIEVANASTTYGAAAQYTINSVKYYHDPTDDNIDNGTVYTLGSGGVSGSSVSINGSNLVTIHDGAGGMASFTLAPTSGVTSSANKLVVGRYQLGASGTVTANSANFSNTITVVGAHQVNTKGITASASSVSKVYDGNTSMTGVVLGLSTLETNDVVTVNGSGAFGSKNAGTGLSYTLSGLTLSGADAGNYHLTGGASFSGSNGVITAAPLTVTASNASKTYDGLAYSGGNGVSYSGFVGGETASVLGGTLSYGGTSQGAVNAGTGYTIVPAGLSSANYAISFANGTLTISRAPLTISGITAANKVYDGNSVATVSTAGVTAAVLQAGGLIAGDDVQVSATGRFRNATDTADDASVGTGKRVALLSSYSGTDVGNYTITDQASTTASILSAVSNAAQVAAVVQSTVPVNPPPGRLQPQATAPAPLVLRPATAIALASSTATSSSSPAASSAAAASAGNSGIAIDLRDLSAPSTAAQVMAAVTLPKGTTTVGTGFSFELPETVRLAAQESSVTRAHLTNGAPLPVWLIFDASTLRFQAQAVPDGAFPIQVELTLGGQRVLVVISERTE